MNVTTARLCLTDFTEDDVPDYQMMTSDHDYQRFYREAECSAEFGEFLVKKFIKQSHEQPRTHFQLAIRDKATDEFIGTVGFRINQPDAASIGFGIHASKQGIGYASEALTALLAWSGRFTMVKRVTADTILENDAAVQLLLKLGFSELENKRQPETFRAQTFTRTEFVKIR